MKSQNNDERRQYYKLATLHNLRFIIRLTEEARDAVENGRFQEYKDKFMKDYYHSSQK